MLLTHNNIVYSQLSRKQKFHCLICNEPHYDSSCYLGYRFGQFIGYACNECCEKFIPKPETEVDDLNLLEILVSSEVCYDEFSLGLNMELAKRYANDTKTSKYMYERAVRMCMRGLINYSRRSRLSREIMTCIKKIRLNLLQFCDSTDKEIDEILFGVLEYCIVYEEATCRKNSAMKRNVYNVLETEEFREKLMEFEWK